MKVKLLDYVWFGNWGGDGWHGPLAPKWLRPWMYTLYFKNSIKSENLIHNWNELEHIEGTTNSQSEYHCHRRRFLFSIKTKENLIEIISLTLMEKAIAKKIETKLVITSKDEFPVETKLGVRIKRRDLKPLV